MLQHFRAARLTMVAALLISLSSYAQIQFEYPDEYLAKKTNSRKYTQEQVKRFGDLGKLWGALQYTHPTMSSGKVITDSLAFQAIRKLISDPSASGFRISIAQMLSVLGDGSTTLAGSEKATAFTFTGNSKIPVVHSLPGDFTYIAFPTYSMNMLDDPSAVKGLLPTDWADAKGIIMDLRNASQSATLDDYAFLYDVLPVLLRSLAGNKKLPAVYERSVYHSGFVSQISNNPNVYSSGWRTSMSGDYSPGIKGQPLGKPIIFVYNRYTNIEIIKQLSSLRAANLCRLAFEGKEGDYPTGDVESMMLADSVKVNVRISEYLLPESKPLPRPDLYLGTISDTTLTGPYITQLTGLFENKNVSWSQAASIADFMLPKPGRYSDTLVPSAEKRLFGLYNFWNAIHYFSPYKNGLDHKWDSIIYKYVPVFLNADDSSSYNLAIRSLASETQDCHGFINSTFATTPARKSYGAWPAVTIDFIQHKLYVTSVGEDSTQDLSNVKQWDEITEISGLPVNTAKEKWRRYFATSNPSTFERDVVNYLVNGPLNTSVTLGLNRNGKRFTTTLKRNGRWSTPVDAMDFNKKHKPVEMLEGNIGYINMGSLRQSLVDSAMNAVSKTSALIFDIRNYPQGTAWYIVPNLTAVPRPAVMFDKPFVTYDYLRGGEDKSTMKSYFTAMPSGKKPYAGKIIILCNEQTQSQAEYTIMMFQGATKCTVIGSQTAGADGNITEVAIPGGYAITFSGLGIYYPDGTPTQRKGIKVDLEVRPTVAGLKAGKDEVLTRALDFVRTGR